MHERFPIRAAGTPRVMPFILIAIFVVEVPLDAYLDPGTGSMLLQVLLGGFAAVGVAVRLYWHRLAAFFPRKNLGTDKR